MSRPRSKTRKEFLGISSVSSSPASSLKKDEPWPTTTSKKNQLFICDDGTERNDRRRRQKCHNAMQLAANGFTKTERPSLRPRFRGGHYVAYKAAQAFSTLRRQKCHNATQLAANGFTKTERPSLRPRFRGGHYVAYKVAQEDFPRTLSPVYNQSHSSSHSTLEEPIDHHVFAVSFDVSSVNISEVPE
ncbi:hypothetical protein QYF36_004465 [Acer negundo]|nr:hypothetical protein QYF36_004465 [Acer negundo]